MSNPLLALVVIGRNEGERLRRCLESIRSHAESSVYVDSGSSDGSAALARSLGIHTIELDASQPFTAARGRNAGLAHVLRERPSAQFVQFVDGDCVVRPGWLDAASRFLAHHPDVAAVIGQLRERCADDSLLNRIIDMDWDFAAGDTDAIGGVAMIRVSDLQKVGGWRSNLVVGEDMDLGMRLRMSGRRLVCLPESMALHEMGIRTVGELWRRAVRSGYGYAELAALHGRTRCRRWLRRTLSNLVYGAILPLVLAMLLFVWWPLSCLVAGAYPLLATRMALQRWRRGDSFGLAVLYGLATVAYKFAGAVGAIRFLAHRATGQSARLFEYKSSPDADADVPASAR